METYQEDNTHYLQETEWIFAFVILSWLGEVIHNAIELPHLSLLSPENSLPGMISLLLFLIWWQTKYHRAAGLLLLLWAGVHLVIGAIISVFPLPFLPFVPEQSAQHYLAHLVYGLTQLPLMLIILRDLKQA